jgi:hypothetical protein
MLAIGPLLLIAATIGLMYSVAATALGGWLPGVVAAAAIGFAPLLWSQFSLAPSTLYPLPLVAAWLMSIAYLSRTGGLWWAGVAGASLGAGLYMSLPAVIMMPCYVMLTVILGWPSRALSRPAWLVFLGSFAIVAIPLLVSWMMRPEEFRATVNAHHLYDANRFNVLQGAREVTSWVGLTARSEVFWDYLNPAFLFVTGRVLAWPLVVLLPVGIYFAIVRETTIIGRLALAGYVAAPLAACLTAEPPTASRIIWIVPFAALLSAVAAAHFRVPVPPPPDPRKR